MTIAKENGMPVGPPPARRTNWRGQSLVELTLTIPVMCLLMLGTIDLGRVYFDFVDLKAGARNGAGYGTLKPTDTAGMTSRVLSSGVPDGTTATAVCTGNCSTVGATGQVVVTASAPFSPITLSFFTWMGIDGTLTVSATATMRVLS
jgi:Flp pilus assembly protein TadG